MARLGCEVDLMIGKNQVNIINEALPYYGLEKHENLRIHSIPILRIEKERGLRISSNTVFHLTSLLKIWHLIHQKVYDAIYLRHLNLAQYFLPWKKILHLPLIFEAHEIFFLTTERKEKKRRIQAQESNLYPQLDGFVAITHGVEESLREIFQIQVPIEVIPDGVNLPFFTRERPRPKNNKIIYVGQLYPWKGVGTLIESIRYLSEGELHLVGGADEQVQKLKESLLPKGIQGRVFFYGQLPPNLVRAHLMEAAVAVMPLTQQNMISARFTSPLKLFEYMAARVPIVASDLPSVREILTNGVNALLVSPDDPQALAKGIKQILKDDEMAERLSQKASQDVSLYSWDKRGERIIRFLRSLAESGC